ncbi:MAG: hypothetical protein HY074_16215 [Deltaproteobacteria bacterium]|nr:hypothetical protein [Deltaproteobacteria bacterium]
MVKARLLAALVFVAGSPAFADTPTREKLELVERISKADGTEQQLAALGEGIIQGIKPHAAKLSNAASAALYSSMAEQFDGSQLFEEYEVSLMGHIQQPEVVAVLPWYDSATGKKICELRRQANSGEAATGLKAYAAGLQAKPATPARAKLIHELDSVTKASELLVDITVNATAGILAGIATAQEKTTRAKVTQMRKELAELRKKIGPKIQKSIFLTFLYTYRNASDGELSEYVAFLRSKAGAALSDATYLALNDTLKKAAQNVGLAVGEVGKVKAEH